MDVDAARRSDLRATARLHRAQLPDGFFARLGSGFLSVYHRGFLDGPDAVALVVRDAGAVVGFLVGTTDNREHYRWLVRRRGPFLAARALAAMLTRPRLAVEFARTRVRRYLRGLIRLLRGRGGAAPAIEATPEATTPDATTPDAPAPDATASDAPAPAPDPARAAADEHVPAPPGAPIAVLTHVAVAPAGRRRGTGRALVEAFVACADDRGASEARLITSVEGAGAAFYTGLGWEPVGDRRASDGSLVREFHLHLPLPSDR